MIQIQVLFTHSNDKIIRKVSCKAPRVSISFEMGHIYDCRSEGYKTIDLTLLKIDPGEIEFFSFGTRTNMH